MHFTKLDGASDEHGMLPHPGDLSITAPWIYRDTTTIPPYGIHEAVAGIEAPRPAYSHNKDGRPDLLSLGVSGDGGIPLRLGLCDGNTSDSLDVRQAIKESLALGL